MLFVTSEVSDAGDILRVFDSLTVWFSVSLKTKMQNGMKRFFIYVYIFNIFLFANYSSSILNGLCV